MDRTSTLSGLTMATPTGIAAAAAASRFGLRPTRLAAMKDLHHFLGHQPSFRS
jgi:hypothetical protein